MLLEDSSKFLLKHMMIFFAPTIVGTMMFFPHIGEEWLVILPGLLSGLMAVLFGNWLGDHPVDEKGGRR
jgi:holin-like protein